MKKPARSLLLAFMLLLYYSLGNIPTAVAAPLRERGVSVQRESFISRQSGALQGVSRTAALSSTLVISNHDPIITGYYNGHTYKVYGLGLSWSDAKLYCENIGGYLTCVTSSDETSFISNLANPIMLK